MSSSDKSNLFRRIYGASVVQLKKFLGIVKTYVWSTPGKVVLGVLVAILVLAVLYGLIIDYKNSSRLSAYKNSKDFKEYSASMRTFLYANNGYYPKVYRCQASLQELWNPPVGTINKKTEGADVQLARQLIDLDSKWRKVSDAFPGYIDSKLFKVLPIDWFVYNDFQTAANLMNSSSILVEHTQDYGYYCPGHFYPKIKNLSYLEAYAKPGSQIAVSPGVISQQLADFASMADKFAGTKTPVDWADNRKLYLSFLNQTFSDLKTLRAKRLAQPSVDMSAQFAADKKALEKAVASGQTAGLKIGPDIKQLKIYFEQTAK